MAGLGFGWSVQGALWLYDSFTGRAVDSRTLRVKTEEGIQVIPKSGGLLVFAESESGKKRERLWVCLESPIFLPQEMLLPSGEKVLPVCLRLWPKKEYPVPWNASRLYGKCLPNEEVFFVFENFSGREERYPKRLLTNVTSETSFVEIYHPGRRSLEGERLELEYSAFREQVLLGRMEPGKRPDTGRYFLENERVKEAYPRLETKIRLVFYARADEEGNYILYFRHIQGEAASGRICMGAGEKQQQVKIRQGESVRADFI